MKEKIVIYVVHIIWYSYLAIWGAVTPNNSWCPYLGKTKLETLYKQESDLKSRTVFHVLQNTIFLNQSFPLSKTHPAYIQIIHGLIYISCKAHRWFLWSTLNNTSFGFPYHGMVQVPWIIPNQNCIWSWLRWIHSFYLRWYVPNQSGNQVAYFPNMDGNISTLGSTFVQNLLETIPVKKSLKKYEKILTNKFIATKLLTPHPVTSSGHFNRKCTNCLNVIVGRDSESVLISLASGTNLSLRCFSQKL